MEREGSGRGKHVSIEGRITFICFCLISSILVSAFLGDFSSSHTPLSPAVCENCMEVDLTAVATIIVVDLCITLGLLLLVYYWSKSKKARAKPVTRGADVGGRPRGKTTDLGWRRLLLRAVSSLGQDGGEVHG